jgi:ABC-2 type transport system ATP-binding protein
MISIENLGVSFGGHVVLDGLSISIQAGSVHGLVGMNGAGKTTLLNVMAGYVKAGSGTIRFHGNLLKREDLSFLETENFFYSNITGREYLELFRAPDRNVNVDGWNQLFRLPLDQLISSYSSGMKKKLALAGALRLDRSLVVLDEPFNGLDLEAARLLSMIITRLKERKKTVLVTSHILGSLTGICDHIHLLRDGKIVLSREKDGFGGLEEEIFKDVDHRFGEMVRGMV